MKGGKKILEIINLSIQIAENHQVLHNISLDVYKDEIVGVIGPNGTGKTTLFLSIAGINKPSNGEIRLFDQHVVAKSFRPELGMVFQNQDDQIFCSSVWDDIAFGPVNMGLSNNVVKARVEYAAKLLDIENLLNRPPHQLSGGEKRLVAIAGVIAMKSRFIIYDEPTSNLDMGYRRRLINFIKETSSHDGMLIASHDLEFILEVCNRVILIDKGRIIADGSPKEILGDSTLMLEHGLETPYSIIQSRMFI